ncbi:MAG: translocation/assembly module TamB domain-containing protein [Saprospiraceae bacterium]
MFLNSPKLKFKGIANGFIMVENVFKPKILESEIEINNFGINDDVYGLMKSHILVDKENNNKIQFNAVVGEGNPILLAAGNIDVKKKTIFGDFTFDDFPVSFMENIIVDEISDTKGTVDGNLLISGPFDSFKISGKGQVLDGSTYVRLLGVRYFVHDQTFTLNNHGIDFTGVVLKDELGNTGVITGGVTYNQFKNWGIDVSAKSDKIINLNTTSRDNPDYYGYSICKVEASFVGEFQKLVSMNVNIVTSQGSHLTVPVKLYLDEESGSFIDYSNPQNTTSNGVITKNTIQTSKIKLELLVTITEDAAVTLILDESTGDYIKGVGTGNIRMVLNEDKEIEAYGDFKFSTGNYIFNYKAFGQNNFISREFDIREGSTIFINGDPFDAKLDIKADYYLKSISLYNLLTEYTFVSNANYKADVDLILLMTGSLEKPEINFDFNFQDMDERIRFQALSKIQRLKSDPNAVYTQAVGLLVFFSFLPEQNFQNTQNQSVMTSGNVIGNYLGKFVSGVASQYITGLIQGYFEDNEVVSGVDISFDNSFETLSNNANIQNLSQSNRGKFECDSVAIQ